MIDELQGWLLPWQPHEEYEEYIMTTHFKRSRFDPKNVVACGVFKHQMNGTTDLSKVNCQRCQHSEKRRSEAAPNGKPVVPATNGKHNLDVLRRMVIEEYAQHGSTERFEALTAATAAYEIITNARAIVDK